jgi:hypothetical protein
MHGKWHSFGARIYYTLGILYYTYQWLFLTGLIGTIILPIAFYNYYWTTFLVAQPSIAFIIISIFFWLRKNKYQLQSANPNLYIVIAEINYELLGNEDYAYSRKLLVRALQHGVDHYEHKFRWTGEGKISVNYCNTDYKINIFPQSFGINEVCRIDFERPLRRKETREIYYKLSLKDDKKSARTFLAHTIYDNTDKVILRVKFSSIPSKDLYKKQMFMSGVTDCPVWEEIVQFSGSSEATWVIEKPRPGYRYQISW